MIGSKGASGIGSATTMCSPRWCSALIDVDVACCNVDSKSAASNTTTFPDSMTIADRCRGSSSAIVETTMTSGCSSGISRSYQSAWPAGGGVHLERDAGLPRACGLHGNRQRHRLAMRDVLERGGNTRPVLSPTSST